VRCQGCRNADASQKNHRRRLKSQAQIVKYTLEQIGERDGWKCHLCRKRVQRTLPGSVPMGPTIDHLVPLSRGGDDTPANVALAHRKCNVARGTRGTVQLLLVG
jgi:5-methylcytosine-specific restriction endonuclease McrA